MLRGDYPVRMDIKTFSTSNLSIYKMRPINNESTSVSLPKMETPCT